MPSGDLSDALAALAVLLDGEVIQHERSPADPLAFKTGAPHAGAHSFDDQRAFEFCDGTDDYYDGATQWAASIDIFPEADVLDTYPIQLVEHIQEVLDRPGDPIRCPHENNIEPAAAGIGHHLIESWPARLGAADPIGVFLHDLIASLSSHLPQVKKLRLRMLIDCGDAQVERGALHARLLFGLGEDPYLPT
jgi:hypothetical protein